MRHCPCADIQRRRHFYAKTTSVKVYIYIDEANIALDISKLGVLVDVKGRYLTRVTEEPTPSHKWLGVNSSDFYIFV